MSNHRTCNACGWVHYGVTRKQAEKSVKEFNAFYDGQPAKVQACYRGPSVIEQYERCDCCGGSYKNMHEMRPDECPIGSTIGPIIMEEV